MQNIDRDIKVAITQGDINGIGYELMLRTFAEPEILEMFTPVIYGSEKIMTYHARVLDIPYKCNVITSAVDVRKGEINVVEVLSHPAKAELGTVTEEASTVAKMAVDRAVDDAKNGLVDVIVLGPADKNDVTALLPENPSVDSEAENTTDVVAGMLIMRVCENHCFATVALDDKSEQVVTKEDVERSVRLFRETIRRDFRKDNPRIAVLAPGDTINVEENSVEITTIAPAVTDLVNAGVQVFGPYTASDVYGKAQFMHFDGIMDVNEGQAERCFLESFADEGVMYYAGLPVVVASAVQTPSHEIAGKGQADEKSFRQAIFTAIDAYRNRFYYDQPFANPLQKMYHERREDGEKVRFAVKKKGFDVEKAAASRRNGRDHSHATESTGGDSVQVHNAE